MRLYKLQKCINNNLFNEDFDNLETSFRKMIISLK